MIFRRKIRRCIQSQTFDSGQTFALFLYFVVRRLFLVRRKYASNPAFYETNPGDLPLPKIRLFTNQNIQIYQKKAPLGAE
jgi:hypothetical protein